MKRGMTVYSMSLGTHKYFKCKHEILLHAMKAHESYNIVNAHHTFGQKVKMKFLWLNRASTVA